MDTRRSTGGWTVLYSGGAVAWSSKRQKTVATSTTQAEYNAAASAVSEIIWQKSFLGELGEQVTEPILLACDSDSAIKLSNNPIHHEQSKHIDIKMHFIRDYLENETIEIVYIPTDYQVADVLTKGVPQAKLIFCRERMGLYPLSKTSRHFKTIVVQTYDDDE